MIAVQAYLALVNMTALGTAFEVCFFFHIFVLSFYIHLHSMVAAGGFHDLHLCILSSLPHEK